MRRMDVWFEVPLGGTWKTAPWRIAYRLRPRGDEIAITELRVFPHLGSPGCDAATWDVEGGVVPESGITARLVRHEVVLGKHVHQLLPEFLYRLSGRKLAPVGYELANKQFASMFEEWLGRLGFSATPRRRVPRRGPKGRTDVELAQFADVYARACEERRRAPVKEVAEAFNIVSPSARDALHKARERGVLTRTEPGRAGGRLTDYGESLLREKPAKKKKQPRRRR